MNIEAFVGSAAVACWSTFAGIYLLGYVSRVVHERYLRHWRTK
jgi:hypothetical protein